jgi:hypothetical protein
MQPELRVGQQRRPARLQNAGCAGRQSVTRIGALQAGGEMRHHHCRALERLRQCEPSAIAGRRATARARASARNGAAAARAAGLSQVVIGSAKRLFARAELLRQRWALCVHQRGPAHRSRSTGWCRRSARHRAPHVSRSSHIMPRRLQVAAKACCGRGRNPCRRIHGSLGRTAPVSAMRPRRGEKLAEAEVCIASCRGRAGAALVGADITRQHKHIGIRGGPA